MDIHKLFLTIWKNYIIISIHLKYDFLGSKLYQEFFLSDIIFMMVILHIALPPLLSDTSIRLLMVPSENWYLKEIY